MTVRAFLLTVAYDGANYFGWQRQPQHITVQSSFESALAEVVGEPDIRAYASSRTDTGVHAIGQAVLVKTSKWNAAAEQLPFALNTKLPEDIVAREAHEKSPWTFINCVTVPANAIATKSTAPERPIRFTRGRIGGYVAE